MSGTDHEFDRNPELASEVTAGRAQVSDPQTTPSDDPPGRGGGPRPGWLPWAAGLAAAAVIAVVAGLALMVTGGDDPDPGASPSASEPSDPAPSDPAPTPATPTDPAPTDTQEPPAGTLTGVPVYWVGPSTASMFL